jgi:hypothetical protein
MRNTVGAGWVRHLLSVSKRGLVAIVSPTTTKWIEDGQRNPETFWERAAQEIP